MENSTTLSNEKSTKKINDFVHHLMDDLSAAERVRMTYLGNQLGLYKAMAHAGPMTVGEVARRTGSSIKLVKHWVDTLSAEGYLVHEPETDTFCLPEEHAIPLTEPSSPFYIANRFESGNGATKGRSTAGHRSSGSDTFTLTYNPLFKADSSARFFTDECINSLLNNWLPAVEGLREKLISGIRVADFGCGRHGASTFVMAGAFPASSFVGFDRYESSVERANLLAKEKRIANAHFELGTAERVYAERYDLITIIECMHLMGELQNVLQECYEVLKPDGILLIAEVKDSSRIREEIYQRLRTSKERLAWADENRKVEQGTDGKEHKLLQAAQAAGFTHCRKASETLYDKVYELRP